MRLLIVSMPLLALTTVFATTAQRVPPSQVTLRESILPETIALIRSSGSYGHTIVDEIDQIEGRVKPLAKAPRPIQPLAWSTGD